VAPHDAEQVRHGLAELDLPFLCLPDSRRAVFRVYEVGSGLRSLGQRPGVFLLGPEGEIWREWRGAQQWNIPVIDEILEVLKEEIGEGRA
jgi:peroxiredoxin